MSAEWGQNGPQRARRRIEQARAEHGGFVAEITVLHGVLSEFVGIGDSPTQRHARYLADFLGCLKPIEFGFLLGVALEELQQATSHAVWQAKRHVEEGMARAAADGDIVDAPQDVSLAELRQPDQWGTDFMRAAVILQALIWAAAPPREHQGIVA
jgi:hypothetical protein